MEEQKTEAPKSEVQEATPAEAVKEPAPKAEKLAKAKVPEAEPKPPEKGEDQAHSMEFFLKRIGELETEKRELSGVIAGMKEAEESRKAEALRVELERKDKARAHLLQSEYQILKPEYMQLAPSIEKADPTTDDGRDALRQWVNSNPGLFGKAPELPTKDSKDNKKTGIFSAKGWTWADKWKDA